MKEAEKLTEEQLDEIAERFDSKEACDETCMKVFIHNRWALHKMIEWAKSEKLYMKRAAFVIIAGLARENRELKSGIFEVFLPILAKVREEDSRPELQEAVSMALEAIRERNEKLRRAVSQMEERKG